MWWVKADVLEAGVVCALYPFLGVACCFVSTTLSWSPCVLRHESDNFWLPLPWYSALNLVNENLVAESSQFRFSKDTSAYPKHQYFCDSLC